MAILTVPISIESIYQVLEFRNTSLVEDLYVVFAMRPVPVPQATSRIEMKLAVKVSQYLSSPVKVVHLEYLV